MNRSERFLDKFGKVAELKPPGGYRGEFEIDTFDKKSSYGRLVQTVGEDGVPIENPQKYVEYLIPNPTNPIVVRRLSWVENQMEWGDGFGKRVEYSFKDKNLSVGYYASIAEKSWETSGAGIDFFHQKDGDPKFELAHARYNPQGILNSFRITNGNLENLIRFYKGLLASQGPVEKAEMVVGLGPNFPGIEFFLNQDYKTFSAYDASTENDAGHMVKIGEVEVGKTIQPIVSDEEAGQVSNIRSVLKDNVSPLGQTYPYTLAFETKNGSLFVVRTEFGHDSAWSLKIPTYIDIQKGNSIIKGGLDTWPYINDTYPSMFDRS